MKNTYATKSKKPALKSSPCLKRNESGNKDKVKPNIQKIL